MVSYKKLYEDLKKAIEEQNKPTESDYLCPECGSVILETPTEWYCSNEECKFDCTSGDLWENYAVGRNLEIKE